MRVDASDRTASDITDVIHPAHYITKPTLSKAINDDVSVFKLDTTQLDVSAGGDVSTAVGAVFNNAVAEEAELL